MPELPEVETISRQLQRVLPGRQILGVVIHLPKMIHMLQATFRQNVLGATITSVQRRAKLLLIELNNNRTIIIHLKMSGQLIWRPTRGRMRIGGHPIPGGIHDLPNKFSHVIFRLTGGTLFFNDQRQFGHVKLRLSDGLESWFVEEGYGPEPLESRFKLESFLEILNENKRKRLKPTLMDQTVLAGVGNIYADEACFYARVRPSRRISTLTKKERIDLYHGLRSVLELAIQKKGTTADAYRTATGDKGSMLPFLKVYGRQGEKCKRCDSTIKKITLVTRGTHYCPKCQK